MMCDHEDNGKDDWQYWENKGILNYSMIQIRI